MSASVVVVAYFAGIAAVLVAAMQVAEQYQQPWVFPLALAGCCFATARYVARGM